MRHPALALMFGLTLTWLGCEGEEPSARPAAVATNADPAPAPSPQPRALSREMSSHVTAGLPKFAPQNPGDAANSSASAVRRELDVPKNGIVRLPNYDVRESRLPRFREREMLTPKGRAALALKRHPGLKFGPFSFLNIPIGLQMLAEEEAYERRVEMGELNDFTRWVETAFPVDPQTGRRTEATSTKKQ